MHKKTTICEGFPAYTSGSECIKHLFQKKQGFHPIPSLKLTVSHLKMDGFSDDSFPFGFGPIFKGLFVSFSEGNIPTWRIIPVSKWLATPIYKP